MLPSVVRKRFQAINSLACITVVITYVTLPSATSICPSETVSHSQKILRFTARSMTCCRFVRGGMQTLISATLAPKNQFLAVIFDLVWKLLVLWCGKLNNSFDHQQSRASEGPHCPRTSAGKKLPGTPCAGVQVRKDLPPVIGLCGEKDAHLMRLPSSHTYRVPLATPRHGLGFPSRIQRG